MPANGLSRWRLPASIALSLAGLAVSLYLTVSHYSGAALACAVGGGCNTVAASPYATLLGVPVALLGTLNYAGILGLSIAGLTGSPEFAERARLGILLLVAAGLVFSVYLTAISATVIGAYCRWCLTSLATITALFFVHFSPLVTQRRES